MKRCRFCAEEVQDAALVCRHCGAQLQSAEAPDSGTAASTRSSGLAITSVALGALCLTLGLLASSLSTLWPISLFGAGSVVALILGAVAHKEAVRPSAAPSTRQLATVGVAIAFIGLLPPLAILAFHLGKATG